jgi:pimeloyl-ACP methyl ester carboxylesterase
MELFADDIAAFVQAIGVQRAHVSGVPLGATTGLWVAAKYPHLVKSLSLHGGWTKSDPFLKVVAAGWQTSPRAGATLRKWSSREYFRIALRPNSTWPSHITSTS